ESGGELAGVPAIRRQLRAHRGLAALESELYGVRVQQRRAHLRLERAHPGPAPAEADVVSDVDERHGVVRQRRAGGADRYRPGLPASASAPAGRRAGARQRRGLARDLRSLLDPLVELVQVGGIVAGGLGALVRDPVLHGREEFARQLAVARVQVEVRLLRVGDAIEREIRLAAVLERIREARLESERLVVGRERFLVVAALAARVAQVIPG